MSEKYFGEYELMERVVVMILSFGKAQECIESVEIKKDPFPKPEKGLWKRNLSS
jgi:hypothetical protein